MSPSARPGANVGERYGQTNRVTRTAHMTGEHIADTRLDSDGACRRGVRAAPPIGARAQHVDTRNRGRDALSYRVGEAVGKKRERCSSCADAQRNNGERECSSRCRHRRTRTGWSSEIARRRKSRHSLRADGGPEHDNRRQRDSGSRLYERQCTAVHGGADDGARVDWHRFSARERLSAPTRSSGEAQGPW
jgi:hypothetical protein